MSSSTESQWLGTLEYEKALALQNELVRQVEQNKERVFIIGVQHPAVITLGRRASLSEDVLNSQGIDCVQTDRGGQATLHSPGQLVIYPVLHLQSQGLSVKGLVNTMLSTTRELLLSRGLPTECAAGAGLLSQGQKIAFLGLRIKNGISTHGLSLNVNNDLSLFASIRACGVLSAPLCSLKTRGLEFELQTLFHEWNSIFARKLKQLAQAGEVC